GYEESQEGRAQQMRWLLDKARKANPSARSLLDVGAGSGLLVAEAKCFGFNATGVEPSRSLVKLARDLYQVDLLQGVFPHPMLPNHRFDFIFLVDVINMSPRPLSCFSTALQRLLLKELSSWSRRTSAALRRTCWANAGGIFVSPT